MRATRSLSLLCLLAAAISMAPAAGDQPRIVLSVDVKEEISESDAQGNVRIVHRAVERAEPGDVLLYTLTYTNVGPTPAASSRVEDPIPQGTTLLAGSALGERARVTFSIDGGKSYGSFPATVITYGSDGKPVTVEAPAEKYSHVRWSATEPLAPGESRTASFKVVVR